MSWLAKLSSFVSEGAVEGEQSPLQIEVSHYVHPEEKLERLSRASGRIKSLLTDVDRRCYVEDSSAKDWLRDLRSVCFDTDDLIDECQTAIRLRKFGFKTESSHKRKWYQFELSSIGLDWGPLLHRRSTSEIHKINERLATITYAQNTLRLRGKAWLRHELSHDGIQPNFCSEVTEITNRGKVQSHPKRIIGREYERREIVDLLLSDLRQATDLGRGLPVIPIYGSAGIGKTALAQMVYEDPSVNGYFDIKVWVCLNGRCEMEIVTEEIYKNMTGRKCDLKSFDWLQYHLWDYLRTREDNKFLLVMDDVWADDFCFWNVLRDPLLAGGEGSKVLITTRNERTCRVFSGLVRRPSLYGLDDDECWQSIHSIAFPKGIGGIDPQFVLIGNEIAKRCYGSPLAARTLGALLHGKSENQWADVLSEIWALRKDLDEAVPPSLKISYHHLPYHLKQCFAYCSIFPKGYLFERGQLIRYWMAEGLIDRAEGCCPEVIGVQYLDELIRRSFFEKIPIRNKAHLERYKLPNLVYDLARLVSEYELRVLEHDYSSLPESEAEGYHVRYASLLHPERAPPTKIACIGNYSNLRTFILGGEFSRRLVPISPNLEPFFCKVARLRVLDLSNSNLQILPDAVGELIHLRYLGLSNTKIKAIPEKVGDLINLQSLELKQCLMLEALPERMNKLMNLRHLDLHLDWDEITDSTQLIIPRGIGKLEELQTLARFNVTSSANGEQCNIFELEGLNLTGELCILNLERVPIVRPDAAQKANLQEKKFIEDLMLRWCLSTSLDHIQGQHSRKVIESLRPHTRLQTLWLVNYPGISFPSWMGDESFSFLQAIRISNSRNFDFLPLLGRLPHLKNLQIDNVGADVMVMSAGYPSLEHLTLLNLLLLECMSLKHELPKLETVLVSNCPRLQELIIYWNLQDKFECGNCPNLANIMCVP